MAAGRGSVAVAPLGVVLWAVVVVLAMGVEGRRTALRDMYCGEADCYSILNLERDATAREIKKAYRALALLHHPDRSNEPDAEQRFQTIAVAYETLRDEDVRRDYDYYLDHPEQALHNMYRYYRHVQVPMTPIVVGVILFISTLQYVSQHTRHSFARRAITYDTKKRQQIKRELHDELKDMTTKERNARVDEEIVSRVRFTGAHAPPDISKLLAVQILLLPKTLLDYGLWQWRWYQKYTRGQEEYADEDKLYLMCRHLHMPRARFEAAPLEFQEAAWDQATWVPENAQAFLEQQRKQQEERWKSSGQYKRYKRYMKSQR